MTPPKKPPAWSWPATAIVTAMAADLCAVTWYLWALPEGDAQRWQKTIGIVAGWIGSLMAFWGIRHGTKKISLAKMASLPPVQLSVALLTAATWFFVLPFHSITVEVRGSAEAPLADATAVVDDKAGDGSGGSRADASDTQGRLRIKGMLAATHRIVLARPGYQPRQISVGFADVLTSSILHPAPLEVADEMVTINSDPAGAAVFVDNETESRGPSGNSILLHPGSHRITLKLAGYEAASMQVEVRSGIPTAAAHISMTRLAAVPVRTYPLTVSSVPSGADIWEGGRLLGTTVATIRLPAGQHTIELRKEGFQKVRGTVSIPEQNMLAKSLTDGAN